MHGKSLLMEKILVPPFVVIMSLPFFQAKALHQTHGSLSFHAAALPTTHKREKAYDEIRQD
jgi:hypothetical protein